MIFALDIDQTIAAAGIRGDLAVNIAYYRSQGIQVPEDTKTFPELLQYPAIIPLHAILPGAVEAAQQLAQIGTVNYFTVRKHANAVREQQIQQATRHWLVQKKFPSPDNVVFCRSVMAKLISLYEREKENQEPLVLIDDKYLTAIEAFREIACGEYHYITDNLQERFTLVAFGTSSLPDIPNGLRVVALENWELVVDIIPQLFQ